MKSVLIATALAFAASLSYAQGAPNPEGQAPTASGVASADKAAEQKKEKRQAKKKAKSSKSSASAASS
jgi:hypothetical protein